MANPVILWVRRDMRLTDNPALNAAVQQGCPIIPVFILSDEFASMGAAPRWRLNKALGAFDAALREIGSRLILRKGEPRNVLFDLIRETGADTIHWSRSYDPNTIDRDTNLKAQLKDANVVANSFASYLLFEPWTVETGQGGMYRVYSPFWRAVRDRPVKRPLSAPENIPAPKDWPASDMLDNWRLEHDMNRGAAVVLSYTKVGEKAALDRLDWFLDGPIQHYGTDRDRLDQDGTSGMSDHLAYGEISPRTLWHAGRKALNDGAAGAEQFLKEIVWREFAWHLYFHTPHLATRSWREEWEKFPWRTDNDDAENWRRGRTGVPVVDAAMREIYVTGKMHNRARMVAASYLTKHLLTDWRVGQDWFAECLIDWDPASNAMGWQWVAGSGPDASPFFRIFNPETQAEKFDPDGRYRRRWIAEGQQHPHADALAFFEAAPQSWGLTPTDPRPKPAISLSEGRARALTALEHSKS